MIGTYVVVRRMVAISGGMSHAAFGGIGLGYYLGIDPLAGATGWSRSAAACPTRPSGGSGLAITSGSTRSPGPPGSPSQRRSGWARSNSGQNSRWIPSSVRSGRPGWRSGSSSST
ncbi:metal ABC transporter permease [Methanoculleus bourgensis]|uniref:metal ABC transporter permease n=1 Tax=Methanoculleus bourgensis TaxID=83986 RepID=UPI00373FD095